MKQTKKKIKPLVNVLSIEPKDVERFWPLAEFMIKEALKYSGEYADAKHIYDFLKKDMMQCFIMFGSDELEENKVLINFSLFFVEEKIEDIIKKNITV